MTIRFSHSSLSTFRHCPQSFKYSYIDKLESLTDKWGSVKDLGTVIHAGISATIEAVAKDVYISVAEQVSIAVWAAIKEHESILVEDRKNYYGERDDDYYVKMRMNRERIPELLKMYIPMLELGTRYIPAWASDFFSGVDSESDDDYVLTEFDFVIEDVTDGVTTEVEGIIDAVLFDTKSSSYVLFDWKVRGRLLATAQAQMDSQLPLYATVLNEIADKASVDTAVMFQMLNTPAKPAKLNKDGKPSIAAQASYWDFWWNSIPEPLREKLKQDEWYKVMVEGNKLRDRESWVEAVEYAIIPPLMQEIAENTELTIKKIHEAVETDTWLRQYSAHGCEFCQFKNLCLQARTGGDEQFAVDTLYRVKK